MAKGKPEDPNKVAQRKAERVAFVQSHPNLAPEVARERFYVQTRAQELSAAGKEVNRAALRQKFESGQVSREGFYTPGDVKRFATNNGASLADTKSGTTSSTPSAPVVKPTTTPSTSVTPPKVTNVTPQSLAQTKSSTGADQPVRAGVGKVAKPVSKPKGSGIADVLGISPELAASTYAQIKSEAYNQTVGQLKSLSGLVNPLVNMAGEGLNWLAGDKNAGYNPHLYDPGIKENAKTAGMIALTAAFEGGANKALDIGAAIGERISGSKLATSVENIGFKWQGIEPPVRPTPKPQVAIGPETPPPFIGPPKPAAMEAESLAQSKIPRTPRPTEQVPEKPVITPREKTNIEATVTQSGLEIPSSSTKPRTKITVGEQNGQSLDQAKLQQQVDAAADNASATGKTGTEPTPATGKGKGKGKKSTLEIKTAETAPAPVEEPKPAEVPTPVKGKGKSKAATAAPVEAPAPENVPTPVKGKGKGGRGKAAAPKGKTVVAPVESNLSTFFPRETLDVPVKPAEVPAEKIAPKGFKPAEPAVPGFEVKPFQTPEGSPLRITQAEADAAAATRKRIELELKTSPRRETGLPAGEPVNQQAFQNGMSLEEIKRKGGRPPSGNVKIEDAAIRKENAQQEIADYKESGTFGRPQSVNEKMVATEVEHNAMIKDLRAKRRAGTATPEEIATLDKHAEERALDRIKSRAMESKMTQQELMRMTENPNALSSRKKFAKENLPEPGVVTGDFQLTGPKQETPSFLKETPKTNKKPTAAMREKADIARFEELTRMDLADTITETQREELAALMNKPSISRLFGK